MDILAAGRPVLAFNMATFGQMGLPAEDVVNSAEAFQERLVQLVRQPPCVHDAQRFRSIALNHSGEQIARKLLSMVGS